MFPSQSQRSHVICSMLFVLVLFIYEILQRLNDDDDNDDDDNVITAVQGACMDAGQTTTASF